MATFWDDCNSLLTDFSEWPRLHGSTRLILSSVGSYLFFLASSLLAPVVKPCPKGARPWLWKNRMISMWHAALVSLIILYAVVNAWDMMTSSTERLLAYRDVPMHFALSFSVGYFFHDMVDNLLFEFRGTVDNMSVIAHHVVVIGMFGLFNWMDSYQGFVILPLITEVNSIFLHLRKLLQLSGVKITDRVYIVNNVLNVLTFFVCRVCGQLYMIYCTILTTYLVPTDQLIVGVTAMVLLAVVNIALANSLFASDLRQWRKLQKVRVNMKCSAEGEKDTTQETTKNGLLSMRKLPARVNGHSHAE